MNKEFVEHLSTEEIKILIAALDLLKWNDSHNPEEKTIISMAKALGNEIGIRNEIEEECLDDEDNDREYTITIDFYFCIVEDIVIFVPKVMWIREKVVFALGGDYACYLYDFPPCDLDGMLDVDEYGDSDISHQAWVIKDYSEENVAKVRASMIKQGFVQNQEMAKELSKDDLDWIKGMKSDLDFFQMVNRDCREKNK